MLLNYNENAFGPSPAAQIAIDAHQARIPRYAVDEIEELVGLIVKKEGVTADSVFVTAGSGDILTAVGMMVGLAGQEVVTSDPAYLDVVDAALAFGGTVAKVPVNAKLETDLAGLEAAITPRTGLVYICNPSNPTGTLVSAADLRAFCERVAPRVPVMVDEAYLDLADDYAGNTLVDLVRSGLNVLITRTFSKVYALAGQRIGYGLMQPAMVAKLRRFNSGGGINLLGVVAASASLRDPRHVGVMRGKIKAGRDALIAELTKLGRPYAVPQTNFVFFDCGMPVTDFIAKMRAENIVIGRPFPPLTRWARISIGLPDEMALCHQALRNVLV